MNIFFQRLTLGVLGGLFLNGVAWSNPISQPAQVVVSKIQQLDAAEYDWIARRIYQNEANQNPKYLTYWSKSEPFPSFGIGHFIWIPKKLNVPFVETFPKMVAFVSQYEAAPVWLNQLSPFNPPWQNRAEFYQAWSKTKLTQLRDWLQRTQSLQAQFIAHQLIQKLEQQIQTLHPVEAAFFWQKIIRLIEDKRGLFAMIDYYNFKGLGANAKEQYQGKGWGLVDVVLAMDPEQSGSVLKQFIASAKRLLAQRVNLSPPERNETRWLKGWYKRLDSYLINGRE
ncbi:hypothetical protein P8629_07605 [Hydrogenovibrio sp. 3SP14C1]|uniref:hypothetical protein n=1 Tax=Hydrogenovibrio sp. 3SP14C1 TaxID=3038774 RepID=UPI00241723B4|nr:hypothetical protein [Hydrogenovibrio sp. 3SP14C1]MDG4812870.1 hypothetical protein [Hydrogenovibrio sp. 3SP14C1]